MYNTLVTQFLNLKEETTNVMAPPTNKSLGSRQVTQEQYPILIRTLFKLAVDKLGSENINELNKQIVPDTIPSNIDQKAFGDRYMYNDDTVCRWLSFLIVAYVSFSKDFGWCPVKMPFRCKTNPEYCVTDPELCKNVEQSYDVQENPSKYNESPLRTSLAKLFNGKYIVREVPNNQNNKPDDKWLFFKPPPNNSLDINSNQKQLESIYGLEGIAGSESQEVVEPLEQSQQQSFTENMKSERGILFNDSDSEQGSDSEQDSDSNEL
jgi:hypothetical protein